MKIIYFNLKVISVLLSTFISSVIANECDNIISYLNNNGITKDYQTVCNKSGELETMYV